MNILDNVDGPGETILNPCFGGAVATIIKNLRNKEFKCTSSRCGYTFIIKEFKGYQASSEGGFYDKYGKRWFIFIVCPKCNRAWSAYEVMNRVIPE
jgi:hypothetical protein